MKKPFLFFLFTFCFLLVINAQTNPIILKEPANWQLEQLTLPPSFAPAIKFKGKEELRFSPGMFKKDTIGYFTYAYVVCLDSMQLFRKNDIKNFLLTYFKGLCTSIAKQRKLPRIDTLAMNITIQKKRMAPKDETIYNILLNTFGVFADGAPVALNMEAKVMYDFPAKKVYLLFIASPQPRTDPVWKELYKVQKNFVVPVD